MTISPPRPPYRSVNQWTPLPKDSKTSATFQRPFRHNAFHLAFRRTAQKYREVPIVGIGDGFTWNDRVSVGAKIGKCDHVQIDRETLQCAPQTASSRLAGRQGMAGR